MERTEDEDNPADCHDAEDCEIAHVQFSLETGDGDDADDDGREDTQ